MSNLLRIIQHMRPKPSATSSAKEVTKTDKLAKKFPGLALPNDGPFLEDDDNDGGSGKKKKKKSKENEADVVDDAMAALEALAPSQMM